VLCSSIGRGESFQVEQYQLVNMAGVDLDLQLRAMVCHKKKFHIIVHIDFRKEIAIRVKY
jgi:hypothetical protein